MLRSTQLRFVALVLVAVAAAMLTGTSARAFSVGNGGGTGGGNAAFGDPDDQVNKALGLGPSEEPSKLGSPAPLDRKSNPYKNFHIDSLTSPPNPLSRPSN